MSTNLRRLKHENVTTKFDANRGDEGQIKARKNAKGEVELVAFFGGKWFYCPMAELNQTLNLRHGAQVNGSDIMSANQKDSSGFTSVRLDVTSGQLAPKLNECKIFVDTVPATSNIDLANCDGTAGYDYVTYGPDTASENISTLKLGLNITNASTPSRLYGGNFLVGFETEAGDNWDYATDVAFTDSSCDTNSSTTVDHNTNAAIKIGMLVTGSGIPANAYVQTKTNTERFILSAAATTSLTDTTLTFTPRPHKLYFNSNGNEGVRANFSNETIRLSTADQTKPNAFFNIVYQDSVDIYYYKFQLNYPDVSPFSVNSNKTSTSASGGSGTNKFL